MTEKEMIEEMAKDTGGCGYPQRKCNKCWCKEERECSAYAYAKTYYEKGYRKIPEGSVVLDRHEHQHYCAYKIIEPQIKGCLDREQKLEQRLAVKENDIGKLESEIDDLKTELKQARKETAKEFAKELRNFIYLCDDIKIDCNTYEKISNKIDEIVKQYGVEK